MRWGALRACPTSLRGCREVSGYQFSEPLVTLRTESTASGQQRARQRQAGAGSGNEGWGLEKEPELETEQLGPWSAERRGVRSGYRLPAAAQLTFLPFHSAPGSREASLSVSISSSGVHRIFVEQFIPSCPLLSKHSDNP